MAVRPRREPHPALQSLLDAPLKLEMSGELRGRIDDLRATTRAEEPDWGPIYDQGIQLAQALLTEIEAQMAELEEQVMALPDPSELRQQLLIRRRKEADDVRARLRTELKRTTDDWLERLKRQQVQVERQCQDQLEASFELSVSEDGRAVTVAADPTSWSALVDFLKSCLEAWNHQACQGAEQQLVSSLDGHREVFGAERLTWVSPAASAPPGVDLSRMRPPREERGSAPTLPTALAMFMRSNLLMVSMFGMMLGAPIALMFGLDMGGGRSSSMRGYVLMGALPILLVVGFFAARGKRRGAIADVTGKGGEKIRLGARQAVTDQLNTERDQLARWVRARSTQLELSLAEWWKAAVEPALAEVESQVAETTQQTKFEQRKLNDAHGRLRKTREDLSNKLIFDLRRFRRNLDEG